MKRLDNLKHKLTSPEQEQETSRRAVSQPPAGTTADAALLTLPGPGQLTPRAVLALQRSAGNRAVSRLIEAPAGDGAFEAAPRFEQRLNETRGQGKSLPPEVRAEFEPHFGVDFGAVRLHEGSAAAELSQAIGARAFTHGRDIYLGAGAAAPGSPAGKRLLAHELTHTVQQGASGHVRGWWPTGHRMVTALAIKQGQFERFYDQKVLNYLTDRSPDIDFIQDEYNTMNRGIAQSKEKIKTYKQLREKEETRQQAIDMYRQNEIHYRDPAYMLSHGEAGQYKDEDASEKNEAMTKRLIDKAVNLWLAYDHGQSMSVLSDALHQAEDRGSHGEGNAFTGHDARIQLDEYDWEQQGRETFRAKTGVDPSEWEPDNASVNRKGLVLGVGFAQGVLESFRRRVRLPPKSKIKFTRGEEKKPLKKRKMRFVKHTPKVSSNLSLGGMIGKTATGRLKQDKRHNLALILEQTLKTEGMQDRYDEAKQTPTGTVPLGYDDMLEQGMVFYERGSGLLENDPTYIKAKRVAEKAMLSTSKLSRQQRLDHAANYYQTTSATLTGRALFVTQEAIRAAYKYVFGKEMED